jgi:RNA recognition motif-containing protein
MMDGLPVDMAEEDISNELRDFYYVEGLEEVRVIRDRQTKKSRQLGFLRFRNLDFARDFMDRNFPSLYLHGPNASNKDKGTKVRIAYSREREDRTRARAEGDWTCKMVRWLDRGISGKLT